jgi:hypothetical protein
MWASSRGAPGTPQDAERALFGQGAKAFLYLIARFAAHLIIKIPDPLFQNLQNRRAQYRLLFACWINGVQN